MTDPQDALKTPPTVNDLTSSVVGRFALRGLLGAGGMGQVYRAEDTTLKRVVAIKRMAPQWQFDERDRQRFLKEAQRGSAVNHRNIAAIYDVREDKGQILLVMEYIEGVTLRQRMKEPISIEEFLDIAIRWGEGLGAGDEERIVHGDIKPENIMFTPAKRVKILDFGVAKRFAHLDANDATESLTASLSGTPAYMAPEVLQQKPYDGRADLFSLGLVFYEMLGGSQPFQSDSFAGTLARVLHADVPPLNEVNRKVPAPLARMVSKMLIRDPQARYASTAAVLADLRRIQRGGTPVIGPAGSHSRARMIIQSAVLTLVIGALLISYRPVRRLWQSSTKNTGATTHALPKTQILAVLPFTAVEGNPKLTALGQGLVESVSAKLNRLAQDPELELIPALNLQEKGVTSLADSRSQFRANFGPAVPLH